MAFFFFFNIDSRCVFINWKIFGIHDFFSKFNLHKVTLLDALELLLFLHLSVTQFISRNWLPQP